MFSHPWIAVYSIALFGIGFVVCRLIFRRTRRVAAPDPVSPEPQIKTDARAAEPLVPQPQTPAGPKIEVHEVPIPGSDLHYYKPFSPEDSIFDVWEKLQAFTSSEPILVRVTPSDDTTPIVRSAFRPDGTLHSRRELFFEELSKSVPDMGPSVWRAVRRLSTFGIPHNAPEASYAFSTGTLRMELRGVPVMGFTFAIRATFEPNLGLIPRYLSRAAEYFHCDLSGNPPAKVGFPWSLTGITLYSEDPGLEENASRITRAIVEKHARYVKQDQILLPGYGDPTRKFSLIADGVVAIAIHEGSFATKIAEGRFLRIEYSPVPQGPLDAHSAGDIEFLAWAKDMAESRKDDFAAAAVTVLDTPF